MSFNGSGTFVVNTAGQPVVPNTVISATAFNALTNDLANGLSTCITKDGQTTPTANIPMGNNKITGLAPGTSGTDAANLSQVQGSTAKLLQSVTGTDTITAAMVPALTSYSAGQMFYFVAVGDNTGAVTINIDSLGAKSVTRDGSTALVAGDIVSGEVALIVYDGTRFQLLNGNSFTNLNVSGTLAVGSTSTFTGAATFTANPTLSGGTANGVLYLNGSKVATSGSALTFDGTNLALTTANSIYRVPTAGGFLFDAGGNNGIYILGSSNYVATYTGGTERMRLTSSVLSTDSSINVGIGTASPGSKLDVRGANSNNLSDLGAQIVNAIDTTAYAQNNGGGIGFGYVFNSGGSVIGRAAVIKAVKENATDGNYATSLVFANAANSANTIEKMRLDSSGNLGLGVTPSAWGTLTALQVKNAALSGFSNAAYLTANAYYDGSNFKYIASAFAAQYRQQDSQHIWFTAPSGTAGNTITFTQAMTLDASGNLGIGTASPGGKLHVLGSNLVGIFAGTNANTVYTEYRYNSTTTSGFIGNGSSLLSAAADSDFIVRSEGALKFATNGNNFRAVIDTSGNFGIGTASPGQKLEVSGNQRFTGSQVGTKIENRNTGINVSTATTILDEAGAEGRVVIVNGANGGDRFCDLVFCSTAENPTVIASFTAFGTPTARTYTRNGAALQLAMASGTYVVNALALGY